MSISASNTSAVTILSELVERCKDGVRGFRTATHDVEDPDLKHLFEQFAVERDGNITEIQDYLHRAGHTAVETTSIEGTLHRAWIDLSSAISAKDRRRILAECERGEDYAISAYRKALAQEALPPEARALVEQQAQRVQVAHDRIVELREKSDRVEP